MPDLILVQCVADSALARQKFTTILDISEGGDSKANMITAEERQSVSILNGSRDMARSLHDALRVKLDDFISTQPPKTAPALPSIHFSIHKVRPRNDDASPEVEDIGPEDTWDADDETADIDVEQSAFLRSNEARNESRHAQFPSLSAPETFKTWSADILADLQSLNTERWGHLLTSIQNEILHAAKDSDRLGGVDPALLQAQAKTGSLMDLNMPMKMLHGFDRTLWKDNLWCVGVRDLRLS